ncbi:terminase TerL endonuclease subunit [uncultured Campylobacter sp.]|uniref:terminase large subunit n=1 Tax=uncultured Campylobacter sp. TaxID=218934 RepID=UPI00263100C5|nr:terminase TerL endonuclease subunit [uncultured Campylobacter sp.]
MNFIKEYYRKIKTGEILVSKRVEKIYDKLINDMKDKSGQYKFDEKKALRPIEFIEKFCKHSKGEWAGSPLKLDLFQKAFISALFGFVDKKTGLRKYKEAFFMVARKNGKSSLLAGLSLYMLIADGEAGAEVYSVATKKEQAKIVFDETLNMVKQSPQLSKFLKKRKSDLYFSLNMSKMMPLGKNSNTLDGLNSHLVVIDELHGVKDRNLYEVMKQSQSARREPLVIMITTAGTVRECIFDDIYEYACNIADGIFKDDSFLPIIYELDSKDEWKDEKKWIKANPGLGSIKKYADLSDKAKRAENSPKDLIGILTKDFNIRESSRNAWLSFDVINNPKTYDESKFKNVYAIGGADLSITTDLTCATLVTISDGERLVKQMYWIPRDNLETRIKEDKIPYDIWHANGLLRLCDGNTIDYSDVTAWYLEQVKQNGITVLWIYYDSYSARYWVDEMQTEGFKMIRCIQGAKTLSLPLQILGADLQAKRVNYNNSPILKWCLSNTGVVEDRNANIIPVKSNNPRQRIDGTASLLNAYVGLCEHLTEFERLCDDKR